MLGEIDRQHVEVADIPGEPRKADDAPILFVRRRVVADIKPKVVERRIVVVSPQLAVKLGHLQLSTLGACLDRLAARCPAPRLQCSAKLPKGQALQARKGRGGRPHSDFACTLRTASARGILRPRLRSWTSCSACLGPDS